MICKKSVEDVVRTKSLTSFVILENRAEDDDDSSSSRSRWTRTKRSERKFRFNETSELLPPSSVEKAQESRFCSRFVFFYRWVCLAGDRVFVIATITAAARAEKKNGSFATTIAASSQEREREKRAKTSVGRHYVHTSIVRVFGFSNNRRSRLFKVSMSKNRRFQFCMVQDEW
jgi:hypothetical protein